MTALSAAKCLVYFGVLIAVAIPLGAYMARVYAGEARIAQRVLGPIERLFYRIARVRPATEMTWKQYAVAVLLFNLLGVVAVYALQRLQGDLPVNPAGMENVDPALSFNTSVSFATNTNWQAYGGETTLSHLTQMLGLTVQNFLSAATAMAVLAAMIRGFSRRSAQGLGNFWVDVTRTVLYILLPLAFLFAVFLVSQGVVQSFDALASAHLLDPATAGDGSTITDQVLALGPAASQIAIKQIGTNGGGFFNANSAHPFENPTILSSWGQMWWILIIPVAQCFMFGRMVGDRRQGWAVFAAMLVILVPLVAVTVHAEQSGNPVLTMQGVDQSASALQGGGNIFMKAADTTFFCPNLLKYQSRRLHQAPTNGLAG